MRKRYNISYLCRVLILSIFVLNIIFRANILNVYASHIGPKVIIGCTKEELVNKIIGDIIIVENITFTATETSAGIFTGGDGIFGFSEGIILSCGNAKESVEGKNDKKCSSANNELLGDSDLNSLLSQIYKEERESDDATVLEFDFIPNSNYVSFQYVLGSEEYPECVYWGDIVGLFVNGVNAAIVPNTESPVSVGTVNHENNASYYIGNENKIFKTQMDGWTTVFSVSATVNKGTINHLKLAIADMEDPYQDTNIFIKANSITNGKAHPGEILFGSRKGKDVTIKRINGSDGTVKVELVAKNDKGVKLNEKILTFGDEETEITVTVPDDTYILKLDNVTNGAAIVDKEKLLSDIPESGNNDGKVVDTGKESTITAKKDEVSNEKAVNRTYKKLEIVYAEEEHKNYVTKNITLPTEGRYGTNIRWESNNPKYITADGIVTLPQASEGEQTIILTATITKDSESIVKTFALKVRPKEEPVIKVNNKEHIEDIKIQDAIQVAEDNGADTINIVIEEDVAKDTPVEVSISKDKVEDIKEKDIKVKVQTGNISVEVPINDRIIDELNEEGTNLRLAIVCEQVDKDIEANKNLKNSLPEGIDIYENHVYDFKMKVIEENEEGDIVKEEEIEDYQSEEDIVLRVFVGKNAFVEKVPMTFYYNQDRKKWEFIRSIYNEDGTIVMLTNHLSVYSVTELTKEEKQQQLVAVVNKDGVTLNEILNVIENKDMKFDVEALKEYNKLPIANKTQIAQDIKTDKPDKGYTYTTLKEKFNDETIKKYKESNSSSNESINILEGAENINYIIVDKPNSNLQKDMILRSKVYEIKGKNNNEVKGIITITYDEKEVNNENQLSIYEYSKEKRQWVYLGGVIDKEKNKVTIEINKPAEVALMENNKTFKDIKDHWAKEVIQMLSARSIIAGDGNGNFNPNIGITRAEFATFITRILKLEISDVDAGFKDVSENDWYAPYIAAAKEAGIVKGISQSEYAPNKVVNRQEMTAMVMRAYRLVEEEQLIEEIKDIEEFADNSKIGDWARGDIYEAKGLKLVKGRTNNIFAPTDETLRGEAAILLYNFLKAIGEI